RRAEQQEFEEKLLAMENARRRALGEEPLEKLEKEDPLLETAGIPDTDDEVDAAKDPFLAETGHILIDLLQLQAQVAKAGCPSLPDNTGAFAGVTHRSCG